MKTYRELYFRGDSAQLEDFTNDIKKYVPTDWKYGREDKYTSAWIYFDYLGVKVDNARVCISTGERIGFLLKNCELMRT